MVLVYIDLLGMKARWQAHGGIAVARTTYTALKTLVRDALSATALRSTVSGVVQSDAIVLLFADTVDAVKVGRALYENVFSRARSPADDRFWLRGVIIKDAGEEMVRTTSLANVPYVAERRFSDSLLRAINLEQGGFKGARLLIEDALVTRAVRAELAIEVGSKILHPLHRFRFAASLPEMRDVMWMIPERLPDWDTWERREERMFKLMKWAGGQGRPDELVHVSATTLAFAECRSILVALARRGGLPGAPP